METNNTPKKQYLELAIHNNSKSLYAVQDRVWSTATQTMTYILFDLVWEREEHVTSKEFHDGYTVKVIWNTQIFKTI
jgi:hypothetical protein